MLAPFRYFEPATLSEAQQLLRQYGARARVLAGGTDLLPKLERQRIGAEAVVALPPLDLLREVRIDEQGGLRLGALVTLAEIMASPLVRQGWPVLVETVAQMATPQVRELATVGGNLCAGLATADLTVTLLALDAQVQVHGNAGVSTAALDQWLRPWGEPGLDLGEILVSVRVPAMRGRAAYQRFTVRAAADLVLANAAVCLTAASELVDEARIVVGAHGLRPGRARAAERMLAGQAFDPARAAGAAGAAAVWADLPDDRRASRTYRQALIRTLVRRALARAVDGPN